MAPGIAETVEQAAQKSKAYVNDDTINGRNARRIILPSKDRITEYWLIASVGRSIVFRLDCSPREYSALEPSLYGIYATLTVAAPSPAPKPPKK